MSSTPRPEPLALKHLLSKPVLVSASAIAASVLLAWAWLLAQATAMGHPSAMADMAAMPGMEAAADPWSWGYLAATFAMWALMMVAMMLPSAAPMILLHARIDRGSPAQRSRDSLIFILCYVAVWTLFSALATIAQAGAISLGLLSAANLVLESEGWAAALLIVAAAWQLSGAKAACLAQCQAPLQFVLRYWRPGAAGAARLGLRHGLYCLGCCWSLMLLLFAAGVMNLAWIAALAAIVFVEKLAPPSLRVERWVAAILTIAAMALLLS